MLPFALSRFITAYFDAPKREPEASVRWRPLHGYSLSTGLQSYVAHGGMAGHDFEPRIGLSPKSKTPFEDAIMAAQKGDDPKLLLEPFVGALELGRTGAGAPFYALISVRSPRAAVVGWSEQRRALDLACADDITSFAALNYIARAVLVSGNHPASRALKPLVGALDDRVAFPPPYDALEDRLAECDMFPSEWMPQPSPTLWFQRAAYLVEALTRGEFSFDTWAEFEQPEADPTKALKNIPRSAPTAIYWMWRLYFEGHDDALESVLEAARKSSALWITDAARVVGELVRGRKELGTIADVAALREEIAKTVRDPSKLAARRAAQRRETIDKRIAAMRVPSGLRFEPVARVPEGEDGESDAAMVRTDDGGLALRTDDGLRLLLPPEPESEIVDAVRLGEEHFAVLVETPNEKSLRRRLNLYALAQRPMRLGGQVFQDVAGDTGIVRLDDKTLALWKEAVEGERMFPWTGRTTLYTLIDDNLVSLGGATFDCVGARVVDGELYGLRADGSGYRATEVVSAVENQAAHPSGPRFAPIPLVEAESEEGWRDCFAPGLVTLESEMLRWKAGFLPRSTPAPEHLRSELGVIVSRDGKTAWLMSRTGHRVDALDLATGKLTKLCEWPPEEGWAVGVAEAGRDLVVASTWWIRVLHRDTGAELWRKDIPEVQSIAGLPSRHFAVLNRGGSGPGLLSLYYVRELDTAPENLSDAAGEWSSYGYAGERMFLHQTPTAIAIAGEDTRGLLDPAVLDKIPHWARSRGWFPSEDDAEPSDG